MLNLGSKDGMREDRILKVMAPIMDISPISGIKKEKYRDIAELKITYTELNNSLGRISLKPVIVIQRRSRRISRSL